MYLTSYLVVLVLISSGCSTFINVLFTLSNNKKISSNFLKSTSRYNIIIYIYFYLSTNIPLMITVLGDALTLHHT